MLTALEQTYVKIGRLYVQSIEFSERVNKYLEILEFAEFSDVVDFAAASGKARKKPNCNPAKSQLCGNACVSLSKKCAKETAGAKKQAADFNTKAVAAKKEKVVKEVAPKTPKATKSKAKKVDEVIEPVAAKAVQAKPRAEDVTPPPKAETLAPVKPASEELSANLFGKTRKTTKSKAKKVEEVTESVAANAAQAKPKAEEITPTPTPKVVAPAPKKEEVPAPVKAKVEDVAPQPKPVTQKPAGTVMKDLTVDRFKDYLEKEKQFKVIEDPNAHWKQSLETFLSNKNDDDPYRFRTKSSYKRILGDAVNGGMPVDRELIAAVGLKLTKKEEGRLAENLKNYEQLKPEVERFIAAADRDVVSDEDGAGWNSKTSEAEALAYTKGSKFEGLSFYHGNPKWVVDSIENDGADPDKNDDGYYGKGTYFAASRDVAMQYAARSIDYEDAKGQTGLIHIKAKMKNPFIATQTEFNEFADKVSDGQMTKVTRYLKAKGYDGIYIKDMGYLVTLSPKQVVTFKKEEFSREEGEQNREKYLRAKATNSQQDDNAESQQTPTHKATVNLPSTQI